MKISELLDNIWPGDTFRLQEVTIIGPYPTAKFFGELLDYRKPKIVRLFADDGVPEESFKSIKETFLKHRGCKLLLRRVSAFNKYGLVHAKLYLFEWKNKMGTQAKRCLVLGSANASTQGFGLHAETYISIRVSTGKEFSDIRSYFNRLIEHDIFTKSYVVEGSYLELPDIGNVWLPDIRVAEKSEYGSSFDSWLRRGLLCHKYERDPLFGKLILSLKQPLPTNLTVKAFLGAGFGRESISKRLSWPYMSASSSIEDSEESPKWRGRYFIETQYGHWVSEDCYRDNHKDFIGKGHEERQRLIDSIVDKDAPHTKWVKKFIEKIQKASDRLDDEDIAPNEYIYNRGADIDRVKYSNAARKKIKADRSLAKDKTFEDRFVSGFSFPPVPQFGEEFEEFALSFCDSVLVKISRATVQNLFCQAVRRVLDVLGKKPNSAKELLFILRDNWHAHQDSIVKYYDKVIKL
jgi:hypothetical protein